MKNKFKEIFIFTTFLFLCFSFSVEAVTLYLEPEEGEYYLDDIFLVRIKLDTEEEEVNAIKAELNFPQNKLEVVDTTKGGSVLVLWPEEPIYSNEAGRIFFIGGIPGGFSGEAKVLSIPFRVISSFDSEAVAEISFKENSEVFLNDKLGTAAETVFKGATFNVFPEQAETPKDEWQEYLKKDYSLPEPFEILLKQDPLIFDGKYFIAFYATDEGTGIDYYEIKEGDGPWKRGQNPYLLEDQSLQGIIQVKAVDKAGNERIVQFIPPIVPEPDVFYKGIYFQIITALLLILILAISYLLLFERKKEKTAD